MDRELTFFFIVIVLSIILLFWIFILKPEIDSFYLLKIKNYKLKFELFVLEKNVDKTDQAYINMMSLFDFYSKNIKSFSLSSILAFKRYRRHHKESIARMIEIEDLKYITPNKDLEEEIAIHRKNLRGLFGTRFVTNLLFVSLLTVLFIFLFVIAIVVAICKKILWKRKFSLDFSVKHLLKAFSF